MASLSLGAPRSRARPRHSPQDCDATVQSTDNDAASSRLSAVRAQYLEDPFASLFSPPAPLKLPIINRGTYVRTTAIDRLVHAFLCDSPRTPAEQQSRKQIISLGAGTDTRFFRLYPTYSTPNALFPIDLVYHELDFPTLARKKLSTILSHPKLRSCLSGDVELNNDTGRIHSDNYYLHPVDLRTLIPGTTPPLPGINPTIPTLIISECCLIYLSPEEAENVVNYFTSILTGSLGMIIYEPINGSDAFGKVMVANLATRGIVLKTLEKYETLEKQQQRLKSAGFEGVGTADVDWLFENWSVDVEKERVAKLEFLDEVEEWRLLAQHYAVVWGWKGEGWIRWKSLKSQAGG
ncbi:leucine carboxyl methyltransferase [Ascodesmis nigricans]|uniref:Leucine carboxyl methyltransferase 1 n=1 Tax=Ascodesmis nigricans TaxID=341454 RepID=A0A4V6RHC0_9PEZI|nr:leucine carboxyl methyltransferase [Ascodesmis nigricans]